MKAAPEGFTIIKQGIGFHSPMKREVPDFFYGDPQPDRRATATAIAACSPSAA